MLKKWVGGGFRQGGFWSFLSWEDRNEIKKRKKMINEFEHERGDKGRKKKVCCLYLRV